MATKELFDKKFVITAVVIGVVYVLVVVLVGIISKEAAGVAGVALTALAVALFKNFETLKFRRMSDEESTWVDVPSINIWRVVMLTFAFVGAQYVFGFASGLLPETWLGQDGRILLIVGLVFFVYFFLSFLMAKAVIQLRYSTVAFAVLLTQIISVLMAAVQSRPEVAYALQYGLGPTIGAQGVFCLVFVVVALLGVRMGLQVKFR